MTLATTVTPSLDDAYMQWLEAEHPNKPGLKNQDRSATERLDVERALRCFALGTSGGVENLELIPLRSLDVGRMLLGSHVEEGAKLMALRAGKAAPSEKRLKNLISYCRMVQVVALNHKPEKARGQSLRSQLAKREKPKRRLSFPRSAWPQGLKAEMQEFMDWKMKPVLSTSEGALYRTKVSREISAEAHERRLNLFVGWLVREQNRSELSLKELCSEDLYTAFLNWHLSQDVQGGYKMAYSVGTSLAVVAKYLVAKGQLEEVLPTGQKVWQLFYALSRKPLEIGAERGEVGHGKDIGPWKPWHLGEIAREAWNSTPPLRVRTSASQYDQRVLVRKRSALFFHLAQETPLRMRNWLTMKWGKNLYQTREGLWEVRFEGNELKVGRRGAKTNVYCHTYSREASGWIDRWREELRARVGDDFERLCPYVFLRSNLDAKRVSDNSFYSSLKELVAELKGWSFHPHLIRHIVASYLVNEHGPGGLGLAAELLGDTVEVVLGSYYKPNNSQTMEDYLVKIKKGDG